MTLEQLMKMYKNLVETKEPFTVFTVKRRKDLSKKIKVLPGLTGEFLADIDEKTIAVKVDTEMLRNFLNRFIQQAQEQ